MSTLSLSLRLSAVALVLVAGAASAGSDPSDTWRGWYLLGSGDKSPIVVVNFSLDASFWVATMRLTNDHQVDIQQNGSLGRTVFHRAASPSEVDAAPKDKIRLFFDARFPKKNPASIRLVSVRRVDECGVKAVYVEPMP